MGFTSQSGQVGFRTQPTKGTYVDPGEALLGIFMRLKGGGLTGKRELIVPDPEIGGNRDIPDAYLGPIIFSGEYEFYARMESLATLMKAALGSAGSATAGVGDALVGTHTFTPTDAIPWLSIEEQVANSYEVFNYTDAKVNTLHLEVDAQGYVSGTVGIIALGQTSDETATVAPDWDTTPLLVSTNVTVTYDSALLPAKKWTIDINNNLEDNDFRLGSVFAADVTPKRREITMGVTIRPADSTLWKQATYGSGAASVAAGGAAEKNSIVISAPSYENIGTSIEKHLLEVTAADAAIAPFEVKPNGDDVLEHDIEIKLFRPDPAVAVIVPVIKNGLATVL